MSSSNIKERVTGVNSIFFNEKKNDCFQVFSTEKLHTVILSIDNGKQRAVILSETNKKTTVCDFDCFKRKKKRGVFSSDCTEKKRQGLIFSGFNSKTTDVFLSVPNEKKQEVCF